MTAAVDNTPKEVTNQESASLAMQETENKQQIQAADQEKPAEEIAEDPNWRAFREARKKDRAEKEAAVRKAQEKEAEVAALKAAMEAAFARENRSGNILSKQEPEYYEESEDERIEKKIQAAIAAREAAAQQAWQEREQKEYPKRLQQMYPDFSEVVSEQHLDYLEYHYPEVAGPLSRLPEGFDRWSDIYKAIKKFVPNVNHRKEAAKAEANFNKPKSISSTGAAPSIQETGYSFRLTEERRAANWERMQKLLRSVG